MIPCLDETSFVPLYKAKLFHLTGWVNALHNFAATSEKGLMAISFVSS